MKSPKASSESRIHTLLLSIGLALSLAIAPQAALAAEAEGPLDEPALSQQDEPASSPANDPVTAGSSETPLAPATSLDQTTTPSGDTAPAGSQDGSSELATPSGDANANDTAAVSSDSPDETPDGTPDETPGIEQLGSTSEPQETEELGSSDPDAAGEELTAGATDAVADKTFFLESSKSDPTVIEAAGGKMDKGTNVQAYTFNGSLAQMWKFVTSGQLDESGNPYYFVASGKDETMVLDVAGGSATNGANVRLWKKNGSDAQLWSLKTIDEALNLVSIISKLSEKAGKELAVELKGGKTANGTNIQLWTSNNSAAQRFYLVDSKPSVEAGETLPDGDGVYSLSPQSATTLATDVKGGSKDNGGNIQLWSSNGSDAQRLIFHNDGTGFYTIGIVGSAKVFDVAGGKLIPGTNVQQYTSNGSDSQKWALRMNANGSYTLVNKKTGLVLDLADGAVAKGANIQGYRLLGGERQQFSLLKDTKPLIPEGIVTIGPVSNPSMVFDIQNGATGNGGKLQLWSSNGSLAQRFEIVRVDTDTYRIRTAASGGWLTGQGLRKGVVQMGKGDNEDSADLWKLVFDKGGYFALVNLQDQNNGVLDMRGGSTTKGTLAQLYASNGTAGQHFVFKAVDLINAGVYAIRSSYGKQVEVVSSATGPAHLHTVDASDVAAQKFQFTKSNGAYRIVNINSGLPISATGDNEMTSVTQKRDNGTDYQLWQAQIADGGFFRLVNVANGLVMATRGSDPGSNVLQQAEGTNAKSELWKVVKTTGSVSTRQQATTRILMIGNSLTYRNNSAGNNYLPKAISQLMNTGSTRVDVLSSTHAGVFLSDHLAHDTNYRPKDYSSYLNPNNVSEPSQTRVGTNTFSLLDGGDWDYVIIQDQSSNPVNNPNDYVSNVAALAELVRACGATPIIYATCAYSDKTPTGKESNSGASLLGGLHNGEGRTRAEMHNELQAAFQSAANVTGATIANVGQAFYDQDEYWTYYLKDAKHYSTTGTNLAAQTIVATIRGLMAA